MFVCEGERLWVEGRWFCGRGGVVGIGVGVDNVMVVRLCRGLSGRVCL